MQKTDTPETPESTRTVELLRCADLKSQGAVELAERISSIASQNMIAQIGSELRAGLDGHRADMKTPKARIDAQNSRYNVLIGMIGFAAAVFLRCHFILQRRSLILQDGRTAWRA